MSLLQDLRFAVRLLIKDRWFTLMAIVALALGIGANNAVFTFVNTVLLRPLPMPKPDQIMWVGTHDARGRDLGVSLPEFEDWRAAARTFSGMTFVFAGSVNVSDEGRPPEQYSSAYVSANMFKMIGAKPVIGRDFGPEDDRPGGPPVVMLGSGIWKLRYGGEPSVLGRTIRLNGLTATVIGGHARAAERWMTSWHSTAGCSACSARCSGPSPSSRSCSRRPDSMRSRPIP